MKRFLNVLLTSIVCLTFFFPGTITMAKEISPEYEFTEENIDVLSISDYSYTGNPCVQKEMMIQNKTTLDLLEEGVDYSVVYQNNINAGTATILLEGEGKYSGSIVKEFQIKAKTVTPKVTISPNKFTYNGKVKKPKVTVKVGGRTIAKSGYSVSYAKDRKNVGTYKVTVNLKGNYTGRASASFTIDPKGTKLSKMKAGTKKVVVRWKKQAKQTDGYQIQYSANSKFKKGVKTKTVKGVKKTNTTIKKLKGGKTYYFRIRTFKKASGKTYFSTWSKTIKATPKKVVKKSSNENSNNGAYYGGTNNGTNGGTYGGESSNNGNYGYTGIVYWTPSGEVYHLSSSCPTLSRSRTILSGTIAESGKPRACHVCGY